ncbi:hypothetical protein PAXRUDRAFT_828996 [Paxillus rubicundulus Ve08.2h10]|uniref:CCHC-type domain-containing protein n=1 Tax=Paxillus rubicundulus Ve08.2h10 TaxID=930991 RepID=A0A0D0DNK5_9AGAM|nr:hypothetical protein PAXRUDRAFT_828996 [Paxillus rubicundulus Ve08.2h10]
MTRVTNLGRKRKYVEAGFATEPSSTSCPLPASELKNAGDVSSLAQGDAAPQKKKRRRTKKPNAADGDQRQPGDSKLVEGTNGEVKEGRAFSVPKEVKTSKKDRRGKSIAVKGYTRRTEQRRLTRIAERHADTVCFACREKGHAARDCPKAVGEGGDDDGHKNVNKVVGMCYRCGSTKHTLSRCKTPEDPHYPLPFASCFVCSGKGHLASSCPQNREKGIYPDGGCCKLCGERTHLAKDCGLRKKDESGTAAGALFGTGNGAGADEDDFHIFKRRNAEVSKSEEKEGRQRKRLDVKAGLHTGTVKAFGTSRMSSKTKKIVSF